MDRFHDVTYRPEPIRTTDIATVMRVFWHYVLKGKAARRFFWRVVGQTLRRSPRSLGYVTQLLGLYKHFCELNGPSFEWDPWANRQRRWRLATKSGRFFLAQSPISHAVNERGTPFALLVGVSF